MILWGGRFGDGGGSKATDFTASFGFDRRFFSEDISASIAHAEMLGRTDIIKKIESEHLVDALGRLRERVLAAGIPDSADDEDIFSFVERELLADIGSVAGTLHTARSRNDQVATDFRLYLRAAAGRLQDAVRALRSAILDLAAANSRVITAGFTHLQVAQPVLLAHHLLAWERMFARDATLIDAAYDLADVLPLGAGALAGVTYPIDSGYIAKRLGFARLTENSMDAVADRDFVSSYLFAATMTGNHLSRVAEEICLWNSTPYNLITINDAYATGSSIMPQKKNPDVAELARAKAGRLLGALTGFLATTKGLPFAYNLDLQEDKEAVFTAEDAILPALHTMAGLISTLTVQPERMRELAATGHSAATDLADYLVERGLTFRQSHKVVGQLVRECEARGINLADADLDLLQATSKLFTSEALERLDPAWAVNARNSVGGTAPNRVAAALAAARDQINAGAAEWKGRPPSLP